MRLGVASVPPRPFQQLDHIVGPAAVLFLAVGVATHAVSLQPAVKWDYAQMAEGRTAARVGGTIEAGYRMLTVPDFPGTCAEAARTRSVGSACGRRSLCELDESYDFRILRIDGVDAKGALLPGVPVAIEVEAHSDVLDMSVADGLMKPLMPSSVHLRVRTICPGRGAELKPCSGQQRLPEL